MRLAGLAILAHDDEGSGPAVVLLHSGVCDRRMWEAQATRDRVREMQRHAFEVQLAAEDEDPAPELVPVEVDPSRVAVPALVVSGGRDLDHFRQVAHHLATTMPQARLVELPAAHLPSLERPDEVNDLVVGFLAGR